MRQAARGKTCGLSLFQILVRMPNRAQTLIRMVRLPARAVNAKEFLPCLINQNRVQFTRASITRNSTGSESSKLLHLDATIIIQICRFRCQQSQPSHNQLPRHLLPRRRQPNDTRKIST